VVSGAAVMLTATKNATMTPTTRATSGSPTLWNDAAQSDRARQAHGHATTGLVPANRAGGPTAQGPGSGAGRQVR
jgi:hypothetical protein